MPITNTVSTTSTISWPMNSPQNNPYPDSAPSGASGHAPGMSCGSAISWRMACGVPVKLTPSGQAPWANRADRPVAVQTSRVMPRRKASMPISRPSGMPPWAGR